MIAKLKKPVPRYRDLTFGQPYAVIGIEADELRIINDTGRPFLYPADLFSLVDAREPADWVTEFGDDGERYSYPPALNKAGFFEDFFDQKAKAVTTFWRVVNHRLAVQVWPPNGIREQRPTKAHGDDSAQREEGKDA